MDEQSPLLENDTKNVKSASTCVSTRWKVMINVMINSIALSICGSAQTQYIYASIKANDVFNNTEGKTNQSFLRQFSGDCDGNRSSRSDDVIIQGQVSEWTWYNSVVENGLAIVVIIFVGPMVDNFGRKPLLLWNAAVTCISLAVKSVVINRNMSLYYFMVGSAVGGLSGTYLAFHLASLSILADITNKGKERTFTMALYDALLGVGVFISYVGVGYLINFEGYLYPFVISAGIFFVFTIFMAVTLDDTWKPPQREYQTGASSNLFKIFSLCTEKQNIKHGDLSFFLIHILIFFIGMLPFSAFSSIRTIFTLGSPFCWNSEHIGWYGAASDMVLLVGATIILKIIHSCCVFVKDEFIVVIAFFSSMMTFVLFGIANDDWMIYGATAAGALRILSIPILKAILSRLSHNDKQGVVMANIYLIEGVCTLGGSTLFNNIYDATVTYYRGIVFFTMAILPLLAMTLMILVTCTSKTKYEQGIVVEKPGTHVQTADT